MPAFNHPKLGRVLFIHIPKCCGSSVVAWLRGAGFNLDELASKEMPHPLYEELQNPGSHSYKFTIVREPLDRFCSMLRYRQGRNRGFVSDENIDAFARDALRKAMSKGYREGSKLDAMWKEHIPPQVRYYNDDVEFFKFEDGFEALQDKLEIKIPFPHVNISDGNATADHLRDTTIDCIKAYYREDYETFGY